LRRLFAVFGVSLEKHGNFGRRPSHPASAVRVFLAGGHHPRACPHTLFGHRPSHHTQAHACILAGGHRSSVELRPSRNPSSNRRRRCRAGVDDATHSTALRRCAALSPTTPLLRPHPHGPHTHIATVKTIISLGERTL
jgi:hypothetical protein